MIEVLNDRKNQRCFVGGIEILNTALIANKVVEQFMRLKNNALVFKLDFKITYCHVTWAFLDKALKRKELGAGLQGWISGSFSSVAFAVLV